MAFRPTNNLIEGVLTNTKPGRVTGWIDFYRQGKSPLHCTLDLEGDFHDDIRGRTLHFWNDHPSDMGYDSSLGRIESAYMDTMHPTQRGKAGDITADNHGSVYIEWYSERNGRVVLNLQRKYAEVLGDLVNLATLPPRLCHPELFNEYMRELAIAFRKYSKDPTAAVLSLGEDGVRTPDEAKRN